jgi:hypothetical protein
VAAKSPSGDPIRPGRQLNLNIIPGAPAHLPPYRDPVSSTAAGGDPVASVHPIHVLRQNYREGRLASL